MSKPILSVADIFAEKMEARTLQGQVGKWGEETFPHSTPPTIFIHLCREIVELKEALGNPEKEGEEMADCYLLLLHLAHRRGVNLDDEARKKFLECKARKWEPPDGEGVSEHIRE